MKSTADNHTEPARRVAPLAGAWIEILCVQGHVFCIESLPLRERGLKFLSSCIICIVWYEVAPLAGAWIEMNYYRRRNQEHGVAPLAGAWIEIYQENAGTKWSAVAPLAGAWIEIKVPSIALELCLESLPLRERGLKFYIPGNLNRSILSLPLRERGLKSSGLSITLMIRRRSPCGSVD